MKATQTPIWGALSGEIYYRARSSWSTEPWSCATGPSRAELQPVVEFRVRRTGKWDVHFTATSAAGDFSFCLEAINQPFPGPSGLPNYRGNVVTTSQITAEVSCNESPARVLSIHAMAPAFYITGEKTVPGCQPSHIYLSEASLGEIAMILPPGYIGSFREQFEEMFDFGVYRQGEFTKTAAALSPDNPVTQCLLAALCMYFYRLGEILNKDHGSGDD